MAYDFLGLVNEINARLNEVALTSSNFASAAGFYRSAKDSVNAAIRDINHTHYEWPFNHVTDTLTLVVDQTRYDFPADAASVDVDSFRVKEDATFGNKTVKLRPILYQEYLDRYVDQEYTTGDVSNVPERVFLTQDNQIGFYPKPDEEYEVDYEYFMFPTDLEAFDDVPTIPERFRQVIVDGAMFHAYMFRSNEQSAALMKAKFEEGLKRMRIMLINDYKYVYSTYIPNSTTYTFGPRVKNG